MVFAKHELSIEIDFKFGFYSSFFFPPSLLWFPLNKGRYLDELWGILHTDVQVYRQDRRQAKNIDSFRIFKIQHVKSLLLYLKYNTDSHLM